MRFLKMQIAVMTVLLAGLMSASFAAAAIGNFNGLIQSASKDEKSLHQKVLEELPQNEVAQAYSSSWVKTQNAENTRTSDISVRLVTTGE